MYKIISGDTENYSDTVVYVRLHGNGCYIPCEIAEAEGACVKIPMDFEDEDDNTRKGLWDIVYRFADGLRGDEPIGEIQKISGALELELMKRESKNLHALLQTANRAIVGEITVEEYQAAESAVDEKLAVKLEKLEIADAKKK